MRNWRMVSMVFALFGVSNAEKMGWTTKEEVLYKCCWNPNSVQGGIPVPIEITCVFWGMLQKVVVGRFTKERILSETEKGRLREASKNILKSCISLGCLLESSNAV